MQNYLKFWGTRGSCPISGPSFAKYGGNTPCLEVRYGDAHLIIDAGTGIRPLGKTLLGMNDEIQLFLGHLHWDHVIGLPFFAPLYQPDQKIALWLPDKTPKSGPELLSEFFSFHFFPIGLKQIKAQLRFCSSVENAPVRIGSLMLHFHQVRHPGVAYGFKIETPHQMIGYATDNEFLKGHHGTLNEIPQNLLAAEQSLIQFFSGCDLLIHEAQYSSDEYKQKAGWGHSSLFNAIALIHEARVGKWLVVHHDPDHSDAELDQFARLAARILKEHRIPCEAEWIGDGHTIPLL